MNTDKKSFPLNLAKPAQRALLGAGLTTLESLSQITEADLAKLHGIGPTAIVQIRKDLKTINKSFAKQ